MSDCKEQRLVQEEADDKLSKKPVSKTDAQVLDEGSEGSSLVKSPVGKMKSSVEKREEQAVGNHVSSQTVSEGRPKEDVAFTEEGGGQNDTASEGRSEEDVAFAEEGGGQNDTASEGRSKEDVAFAEEGGGQNDTAVEDAFSTVDLVKEIKQLREQFFRAKAETANILRRSEREMDNTRKYFVRSFLVELLEVRDSLEKATDLDRKHATVEHYRSGLELTLRSLEKFFAGHDVAAVDPVDGVFDPELHQAMGMQESANSPPGAVLNVIQKGYTQRGRLLRPALVIVSTGQEAKPAAESETLDADEDK